jgi:opacity protein-like surface antigen
MSLPDEGGRSRQAPSQDAGCSNPVWFGSSGHHIGAARTSRDFASEFAKSQPGLGAHCLNSIAYLLASLLLDLAQCMRRQKMNRSMISKKVVGLIPVVLGVILSATTVFAQVEQPSQISIQGTALITKSSNDQIPSNDASKSGGLLVGYSYQFSRWFGAEGNYGYSRNTQNFVTLGGPTSLQADFHEVTGALVAHIPVNVRSVRPYVLGGGGALVFDPTEKFVVNGSERQTRGTFVYGGGVNFDVTRHLGVRAEYRGLVYKVPDFGLDSLNLDKFTHLAQPSVGFFVRF